MGIPWLVALKAIPWGTILANAPAILRSADSLAGRTKARPNPESATNMDALAARTAQLEQRDRETAELLTQVTAQLTALTAAGEVLEARARWLLIAAIAALLLSIAAIGVALFAR